MEYESLIFTLEIPRSLEKTTDYIFTHCRKSHHDKKMLSENILDGLLYKYTVDCLPEDNIPEELYYEITGGKGISEDVQIKIVHLLYVTLEEIETLLNKIGHLNGLCMCCLRLDHDKALCYGGYDE